MKTLPLIRDNETIQLKMRFKFLLYHAWCSRSTTLQNHSIMFCFAMQTFPINGETQIKKMTTECFSNDNLIVFRLIDNDCLQPDWNWAWIEKWWFKKIALNKQLFGSINRRDSQWTLLITPNWPTTLPRFQTKKPPENLLLSFYKVTFYWHSFVYSMVRLSFQIHISRVRIGYHIRLIAISAIVVKFTHFVSYVLHSIADNQ